MFKIGKKAQALSGAVQAYNRTVSRETAVTYKEVAESVANRYELARAIKTLKTQAAFNRKMSKLDIGAKYEGKWSDISGRLGDAKSVGQYNARLSRFLRPGAEKVRKVGKNGVLTTTWEIKEMQYARTAANKNRAIMRDLYLKRMKARHRDPNKWEWAPYQLGPESAVTRRDLVERLRAYIAGGVPTYVEDQFDRYRANAIKAIEWMKGLPEYEKLKKLIETADRAVFLEATNNPYNAIDIEFLYRIEGEDAPALPDQARMIYERWERGLK